MNPVYLLDTNVISEFTKPKPNSGVMEKIKELWENCVICSPVWQEAIYGLELMPEGRKREAINKTLQDVKRSFKILQYDSFTAQICGEIQAKCEKKGKPVPKNDSQIAATAISNNMVLITHNVSDFEAISEISMLHVEDWWA